MPRALIAIVTSSFLLFATSCIPVQLFYPEADSDQEQSTGQETNEPAEEDGTPVSESEGTVVRLVVDESSIGDVNELVVVDSRSGSMDRQSVFAGQIEIALPRDSHSLVGFVRKTQVAGGARAQSLSGTITLIGNLSIVSHGLDSIPLSDSAAPVIDLGSLTVQDQTFVSDAVFEDTIATFGTSAETIEQISLIDDTMAKLMNPDINGNGVYDSDEGIWWEFGLLYFFQEYSLSRTQFDTDPFPIAITDLFREDYRIYFQSNIDDASGTPELYLPSSANILDGDGLQLISLQGTDGSDMTHIGFLLPPGLSPRPPYDGNYEIHTGNSVYRFNNLKFYGEEDDFEGFVFPTGIIERSEDGTGSTITWRWIARRDGQYLPATRDQVYSVVKHVSLEVEAYIDNIYTRVGISSETDLQDELRVPGEYFIEGIEVIFAYLSYSDIAGNTYYLGFRYSAGE